MRANDSTFNKSELSDSYKTMMDGILLKLKEGKLEFTPVEEVLVKYL